MHEQVVVPCNLEYGDQRTNSILDPRKVIFKNATKAHIIVTVVDPKTGICAEAMIRKDALPAFVTDRTEE